MDITLRAGRSMESISEVMEAVFVASHRWWWRWLWWWW